MQTFDIIFKGLCNGKLEGIARECENSEEVCVALFLKYSKTCTSHCRSLGLKCENGWNYITVSSCSKASADVGCDYQRSRQICRCTPSKPILNPFSFLLK